MQQQRKSLPTLPPSNDEIWEDNEVNLTDMSKQPVLQCESMEAHEFEYSEREFNCRKCGFGFHARPEQLEEVDGVVYYKGDRLNVVNVIGQGVDNVELISSEK